MPPTSTSSIHEFIHLNRPCGSHCKHEPFPSSHLDKSLQGLITLFIAKMQFSRIKHLTGPANSKQKFCQQKHPCDFTMARNDNTDPFK